MRKESFLFVKIIPFFIIKLYMHLDFDRI